MQTFSGHTCNVADGVYSHPVAVFVNTEYEIIETSTLVAVGNWLGDVAGSTLFVNQ